jgi:hypothetical protein
MRVCRLPYFGWKGSVLALTVVLQSLGGSMDDSAHVAVNGLRPRSVAQRGWVSAWKGKAGPAVRRCPQGSKRIHPGQEIQRIVDRRPPGSLLCIRRGLHRIEEAIRPKRGMVLVFENEAVVDGAKLLTNWQSQNGRWVSKGNTQSVDPPDNLECRVEGLRCEFEDVFLDGRPMQRVSSIADLKTRTFFFDEAADEIWITDDPFGRRLEATVAEKLIDSQFAKGVVIRGGIFQHCGRVGIATGGQWRLEKLEVRFCHGVGLRVYGRAVRVSHVHVHHAGQMGIFANNQDHVFNEIHTHHNNYLGFTHSKGGAKIVTSSNVVLKNSYIHDNYGAGWHLDWDNVNYLVKDNIFQGNVMNLLIEGSQGGSVIGNVFRSADAHSLGINTSKNVRIVRNRFVNNSRTWLVVWQDRGSSDRWGERETTGLLFSENRIVSKQPDEIVDSEGDERIFSSRNTWKSNVYVVPDRDAPIFDWIEGDVPFRVWKSYGHDVGGSMIELK